ncbi:MAG TPA: 2-oxoacid:acceptor oxidoreductase family protein [Syntrophales bacterium]|jgi:2-oxoglutarate ferredoxin oxidoreductase subunit gamma|nr:2-oxoacid:ferredoxin oxidoreductase subunit gamma [Deltaproteobacteria bacterium]HNU84936.1 2-oxoacid:acceptor oxidoreductase family protein [Syntrophales bacterium]HNZ34236.1 2-oxoacid:acceptor oxidoreductase family protein [Syntrophales bacterium]HOH44491.1 2-oxoacid:acceptor oxidoreductase family protein [Syntrophales bacterium]HOR31028.1 2-oxoacid:acceptor oxidoreductase family protein [Syntrophales bacterium]
MEHRMTTESKHVEVILAGTGGQGLILSGILLAEAAILEGKNVVQTQSYGIASRGGLSLAEVIIDTGEIVFQQVQKPDCILVLTEEATKKYETWAAKGVPILYDSTLVNARTDPNFTGYAFTQTASDMGNALSVNILALGTVTAKTGVVKMETLEEMIRKRFKGAAVEMNLKMLAVGRDLAGR